MQGTITDYPKYEERKVEVDLTNGFLLKGTFTETTFDLEIPPGFTEDVSFAYGDGTVDQDSIYELDVVRPDQVTDANAVVGFERFFTLSDFGFTDIEGLPLKSVLIQVPNAELGSINIGPGRFLRIQQM